MIYLTHIAYILIGAMGMYIYFLNRKNKKLKSKYNSIKKSNISKEEYENILKEKETTLLRYEKLKKYMGLVNEKEYGIIEYEIYHKKSNQHFIMNCGFNVIERGKNKVRIEVNIDDMSASIGKHNSKESYISASKLINGWYDINDDRISWIEPDDALKRDINIDNILD